MNPTFLPNEIRERYDELWTEQRMMKVINALAENGIALEINTRYKIPSPVFIKLAKKNGVKFTFGTNNGNADLGYLEYGLEMIEEITIGKEKGGIFQCPKCKRISSLADDEDNFDTPKCEECWQE